MACLCGGLLISMVGCHGLEPSTDDRFTGEDQHLVAYLARAVPVTGTVLDGSGKALQGAVVKLGGVNATTDAAGRFSLQPSGRGNALLQVSAPGFRTEQIPVVNLVEEGTAEIRLDPILLTSASSSVIRMLFGGDTAFGRRWLSPVVEVPRGQMPPQDPNALVQVQDPAPGTVTALQWIRPHFQEADWRVLNFETPATTTLTTPHPTKEYCFFTLPGSIPPLKDLGVDYVSLGNNHVYDYLETGLQQTLTHLENAGIHHSGAGADALTAFRTFNVTLKGSAYSFFSACSIDGSENGFLPLYTASSTKGGCADLQDTASVRQAISSAAPTAAVVAQLHSGYEYALSPSSKGRSYVKTAVEAGAKLVVGNHSHVPQGVGLVNGVPVLYCLGNLALDQDRLETFLGSMARVDMAGSEVKAIRLLPIYLEDYRPRLVNGFTADYLVRRQAEFSDANVRVFPFLGQGWVALDPADALVTTRTVNHVVVVPDSGEAIIDLRDLATSRESLSGVSLSGAPAGTSFQMGRDILVYGDFEDWDTDTDTFETSRWDLNTSQRVCLEAAWKGAVGLRLKRDHQDVSDAVAAFRERVRVEGENVNQPNKNLSLLGKVRGTKAGPVKVVSRYYASKGEKEFGEEAAFTRAAGTYGWEAFAVPLHMPPDALPDNPAAETDEPHALRIFVHHSPGTESDATVDVDNLAVVNWQGVPTEGAALTLRTPHALDFLKVRVPKGTYTLSLSFQQYRPKALP